MGSFCLQSHVDKVLPVLNFAVTRQGGIAAAVFVMSVFRSQHTVWFKCLTFQKTTHEGSASHFMETGVVSVFWVNFICKKTWFFPCVVRCWHIALYCWKQWTLQQYRCWCPSFVDSNIAGCTTLCFLWMEAPHEPYDVSWLPNTSSCCILTNEALLQWKTIGSRWLCCMSDSCSSPTAVTWCVQIPPFLAAHWHDE